MIGELLGDDGERSIKALVCLLNSDVLLDCVPVILDQIDDSSEIILDLALLHERTQLPRWAIISPPLIQKTKESRKTTVLTTLCDYIRNAEISEKRDKMRRCALEYLKRKHLLYRSGFFIDQMHRLYFWGGSIEPESDCLELMTFVTSILEQSDTLEPPLKNYEMCGLNTIVCRYISTRVF